MKEKNKKIIKIFIVIIAIIILIGMFFYMIPIMRALLTEQGKEEYAGNIKNAGFIGIFMLIGLEIAQVFLAFLPGEPIEIVAGMCYGSIWGTLLIMISSGIISAVIYMLVRRYGKSFIYNFCSKEKLKKWENSKILKNEERLELIMLMLFLIPGTPKDLLVYLGGILPIKPIKFILIATFGKLPSIYLTTLLGETLIERDIKTTIITYIVTILIVAIIVGIIQLLKRIPKKHIVHE